ncbi:MAG: hypothetical protein ACRD5G_09125 [Candidatus Acidiferrales bacterium]
MAILAAVALWVMGRGGPAEYVYVLTPKAALWSRMAVVREPLVTLRYGEQLGVLGRREDHVRVRTEAGVTGWIDARHLISSDTWQRATALRQQAAAMPLQSSGITKVRTNVRLEPGRAGVPIFQFLPDSQVEVLAREVVEWVAPVQPRAPADETNAENAPAPKKEDWLLVRGIADDTREVAGWVLGRFLAPEYPQALHDYAGVNRFLAWFKLSERQSEFGPRPTWLAAGVNGPEGQPCDFTLLRVYNWNARRARYETAYVESNLCGRLPVRVKPAANEEPRNEASFTFTATGRRGSEEVRTYLMRQNIVRRVRQ